MGQTFLSADLRRLDYDRYLLSLFVPEAKRDAVQALFLFDHEIARTRSMVTDTNLGLIRLQWWRDEIARLYAGGDGGEIPILSTMAPLIHQQALPQDLFDHLIYAHEFDLEDVQPETMAGLRHYADFTTTPINRLALKMMGESAEDVEIGMISLNFGLIRLIRDVPLCLKENHCLLPKDHFNFQRSLKEKDGNINELKGAIESVLSTIDSYRKPKNKFLAIQQRMTQIYLNKFNKLNFDLFDPRWSHPPAFFALRLWGVPI